MKQNININLQENISTFSQYKINTVNIQDIQDINSYINAHLLFFNNIKNNYNENNFFKDLEFLRNEYEKNLNTKMYNCIDDIITDYDLFQIKNMIETIKLNIIITDQDLYDDILQNVILYKLN